LTRAPGRPWPSPTGSGPPSTPVSREDEAIADAVYAQFPSRVDRIADLRSRLGRLPGPPALPKALERFEKALNECRRSRQVAETVASVKRVLDDLRDGFEILGVTRTELTEESVEAVRDADRLVRGEVAQLHAAGELTDPDDLSADAAVVEEHMQLERPWRDTASLAPRLGRLRARYADVRQALIARQGELAEQVRSRIQTREGFARLSADQAHSVLAPIGRAVVDTKPWALAPSLVDLRDGLAPRLARAEDEANERLDTELARLDEKSVSVVKVEANLRGRELKDRPQLEAMLRELEERIGPALDRGARVRIV